MRFITPTKARHASGPVAGVYREVRREFGLVADLNGNSPFLAHSPHPELLAGFWSMFYETVLVEDAVRRVDKEAMGATVSRINDCPFCLEAHALITRAGASDRDQRALLTGAIDDIDDVRRRQLVAWAAATRSPGSASVRQPPFSTREAPETIGTAVGFHYVNRVVEVIQGHVPINIGPELLRGVATKGVVHVAGRALRRQRRPGSTLGLLPETDLPADLAWAHASPYVTSAFARFADATERAGSQVLSETERACVTSVVASWDGEDPPLGTAWLDDVLGRLDVAEADSARLGVLTALAPYRVDDRVVEGFRRRHPRDQDLVAAVSWSAFAAARRIGSWLHQPNLQGSTKADGPA